MGFNRPDPNALAGVAFLNAACRLAGGAGDISIDEWTQVVKNAAGNDPAAVANQVLDALSGRLSNAGVKVGQALDGKISSSKGAAAGNGTQGIAARNKAIYQQGGGEPVAPPASAAAKEVKRGSIADARAAYAGGEALLPEQGPPIGSRAAGSSRGSASPTSKAAPSPTKAASPAAAQPVSAKTKGSWTGPGLFLIYNDSQNGSLFCVCSKTPVPNALAYGKPNKPIPEFKYTNQGGRTELQRGAADVKQYMKGFATFFKACKSLGCQIDLQETGGPFEIQSFLHHTSADKVTKLEPGNMTGTESVDAFGVIPRANNDLAGVQTMAKGVFVQRADLHGGSAS
ncbi:hypothetical protein DIPPA_27768 [Diplonema papillatum]|nr:hypothetical protein DIPPA_27768 [Diplonema papillatum]